MADITLYPRNILEDATVTVTGTAETRFPESRLYDRAIDLFWRFQGPQATDFRVDYGAAVEVDFLAIPKHNFNGQDMEWNYSTDDFAIDNNDMVVDWTQGDNDPIIKVAVASQTKRYWRVLLENMPNPKASEIYMSFGYTFEIAKDPDPQWIDIDNVQWNKTIGGVERSTKFGDKRRKRNYLLTLTTAQRTLFRTAVGLLNDYSKPFYIRDHEDNYFMCRFLSISPEDFINVSRTRFYIEIIEEL